MRTLTGLILCVSIVAVSGCQSGKNTPGMTRPDSEPGQRQQVSTTGAQVAGMQAPESSTSDPGYMIAHFDEIDPIKCSCGWARRAFVTPENPVATAHVVDITKDAKAHYHKKMTEIYFVLEADDNAMMELNGKLIPVKEETAIFIKPGTRHRAVGQMKILNIPVPAYDSSDVFYD
jgi:mannose-6-phosphate isomerase-like protein (cupin superfamily)